MTLLEINMAARRVQRHTNIADKAKAFIAREYSKLSPAMQTRIFYAWQAYEDWRKSSGAWSDYDVWRAQFAR